MALGAYGTTAITALTAQNTLGVQGVFPVDPAFIARQMESVLDDIGSDAIKTGMLHSAEVIDAVADVLEARCSDLPIVVDPVMVSTQRPRSSGASRGTDPDAAHVAGGDRDDAQCQGGGKADRPADHRLGQHGARG